MMYLQAFGGAVALLVILLISAPMRSAFFKTNLKKDIKFILIFWSISTAVFLIWLLLSDLDVL